MPLATMMQMIEIGESDVNLDGKEWSSLLNFILPLTNFDSGYCYDSKRNPVSMWHNRIDS